MTRSNEVPQPQTVTPYLLIEGVDRLIEYCVHVFEASVHGSVKRPDGSVMHAEVEIGGNVIMMGEPMGEFGPAPGWLFVRVPDCDATYARALAAGGESVMEVANMYHAGERYGGVKDPHGNVWWIATPVEDVPWDEQQRRIDALVEQGLGL